MFVPLFTGEPLPAMFCAALLPALLIDAIFLKSQRRYALCRYASDAIFLLRYHLSRVIQPPHRPAATQKPFPATRNARCSIRSAQPATTRVLHAPACSCYRYHRRFIAAAPHKTQPPTNQILTMRSANDCSRRPLTMRPARR